MTIENSVRNSHCPCKYKMHIINHPVKWRTCNEL